MRVCVVGVGRMGLAVAVQFAGAGADVLGCDIDEELVDAINAGTVQTADEPGLGEHLKDVLHAGRLVATTDTTAAVRDAQAVIVLVRLETSVDGSPDYSSLDAATAAIAAGLSAGTLVSYETTLPVGDTRTRFAPALAAASGLSPGSGFHLCFSPERVSSGSIFRDLATYPKIVGGLTVACADAGVAFYAQHIGAEVMRVASLEAAEFTKVAETTFRDVNIALANEFARFADEVGVDFSEVARAANSQPFSHLHTPGIGVGGHCIPVYPRFFMARASDSRLVGMARQVNEEMPGYAANRLETMMGSLVGRRVLVLGLSFRAELRESSRSTCGAVVDALRSRRAEVRVHDPLFGRDGVEAHGFVYSEPSDGWAEALVLHTAHAEYARLDPCAVPGVAAVLDGRMALCPDLWRKAGIVFGGIGR